MQLTIVDYLRHYHHYNVNYSHHPEWFEQWAVVAVLLLMCQQLWEWVPHKQQHNHYHYHLFHNNHHYHRPTAFRVSSSLSSPPPSPIWLIFKIITSMIEIITITLSRSSSVVSSLGCPLSSLGCPFLNECVTFSLIAIHRSLKQQQSSLSVHVQVGQLPIGSNFWPLYPPCYFCPTANQAIYAQV